MSAYFITATGTGIGKTFATCALIHAARGAGKQVQAYKPIISGWDPKDRASDTAHIIAASGQTINAKTVEDTSPWRFWAPLSPHQAAAQESQVIDVDTVVEWSRERAGQPGLTLIEGVGGVMVPLTDTLTTLDWMQALQLPVILVTGSYLGTISHTLTALVVLRSAGLTVTALVMNETDGSAVTLEQVEAGLAPFIGDIPLRIVQPRVSSPEQARAIHALVERL